jgi:hypothetical protein
MVDFLAAFSLAHRELFLLSEPQHFPNDSDPVLVTLFCLIGRRFPSRGVRLSEQSAVPITVLTQNAKT